MGWAGAFRGKGTECTHALGFKPRWIGQKLWQNYLIEITHLQVPPRQGNSDYWAARSPQSDGEQRGKRIVVPSSSSTASAVLSSKAKGPLVCTPQTTTPSSHSTCNSLGTFLILNINSLHHIRQAVITRKGGRKQGQQANDERAPFSSTSSPAAAVEAIMKVKIKRYV